MERLGTSLMRDVCHSGDVTDLSKFKYRRGFLSGFSEAGLTKRLPKTKTSSLSIRKLANCRVGGDRGSVGQMKVSSGFVTDRVG
jgi:hypothetical protein